jgi:hypothetical protein
MTVEFGITAGYLSQDAAKLKIGHLDSPKATVVALIAKSGVEESKKKNVAAMCRGLLAEIERVDAEEEKEKELKRREMEAREQQRQDVINRTMAYQSAQALQQHEATA